MVLAVYTNTKFFSGGGHANILGLVNSYVHVIMYGYYFVTSFKPELKESIWWKRYITQVQMAQFAFLVFHNVVPLLKTCAYPKFLHGILILQNLFMLILFGDFYYKAYVKKNNSKKLNKRN